MRGSSSLEFNPIKIGWCILTLLFILLLVFILIFHLPCLPSHIFPVLFSLLFQRRQKWSKHQDCQWWSNSRNELLHIFDLHSLISRVIYQAIFDFLLFWSASLSFFRRWLYIAFMEAEDRCAGELDLASITVNGFYAFISDFSPWWCWRNCPFIGGRGSAAYLCR